MTSFINYLTELFHIPNITIPFVGEISLTPLLLSITIYAISRFIFWAIQFIIIQHASRLVDKTNNDFDNLLVDTVKKVRPWFYSFLSFYLALLPFSLSETIDVTLTTILLILVAWQVIDIASGVIAYIVDKATRAKTGEDPDPSATTAAAMINLVSKIALWSLGIIFVLSNLGFEVTSLIAGLGIGGVAIAFALQGILSDLFASFSIYFDQPFRIGDVISIGTDMGTVEKIGIKSTRIRTLQGEELIVSNAELVTARVQNFRKMIHRRATAQIGITYDTHPDKVASIPKMVEDIFADIKHANLDWVFFTSFGDSALIFDIVYHIDDREFKTYLTAQQEFNLGLLKRFNEEGIEFAFPTRTVYTKTS